MSDVEDRLAAHGFDLPDVSPPLASYVPAAIAGELIFTAGQVPRISGSIVHPGKVGEAVSLEQAAEAVRVAVLQALSAIRAETGELERIERIVKMTVFVSSAPAFNEQSRVADAGSQLLEIAFGERGKHSRSAVGVSELPLNSCVEVELIAQLRAGSST